MINSIVLAKKFLPHFNSSIVFFSLSLTPSMKKLQQASELLPIAKPQTRRKTQKLIPFIALTFILTIIPLYFPYSQKKLSLFSQIGYSENTIKSTTPSNAPPKPINPRPLLDPRRRSHDEEGESRLKSAEKNTSRAASEARDHHDIAISPNKKCDLFSGEWVPNPEGPYYTNATCSDYIQEHQNCMKFGRPDLGFLKWRWKPDECELPIFDPYRFLEMVRGKSLAFVGDSVARNHMQSLICLLSKVVHPVDVSKPKDENRLYHYTEHNFNITIISSPYLIRTERTDPNDFTRPYNLLLDEFDDNWTSKIESFDYIIISAGQWFFRPTYFYLNRTLIGCLYCPESNVTHLTSSFSYRRAFQTAFRAINAAANFSGVAFLRTFAPSHFEGGPWDSGGDCVRTTPFKRNETALEDFGLEMYSIQLEELRIAQRAGRGTGGKVRLFDATRAMLLRADGHPSKYGHWPVANQTIPNDCVHWCLPGPIDAWNDFLQELLKREVENYSESFT